MISVCENEFGAASDNVAGSAGFVAEKLQQIISFEKQNCHHVIVVFHGGNEHNPLPAPKVQERYRFIINAGASAVIGMHPHCIQGYEYYNYENNMKGRGYIVYSLGNFFFPKFKICDPYSRWYNGYIVHINISRSDINLHITPYRYSNLKKQILPLQNDNLNIFWQYINKLNDIIKNPVELNNFFAAWCLHKAKDYARHFNSQNGDYSKRQCLEIQNLFRCEAHKELMQNYFELLSKDEKYDFEDYIKKLQKLKYIPVNIENHIDEIKSLYKPSNLFNENKILNLTKGKEVIICGAGKLGTAICQFLILNGIFVSSFLDNNKFKIGERIFNVEVNSFKYLKNINIDNKVFIIAITAKEAHDEIVKKLIEYNVDAGIIISENS